MSILVTGGAGFVGSSLVDLLLDSLPDTKVIVLDALVYPVGDGNFSERAKKSPRFELVRGSVSDTGLVTSLLREGDVVIHMAVETGRPDKFIETQLGGTKNLLDASLKQGVERFIYQSTCDVYGINNSDNLTESDPVRATHLYAATKLGAEGLVTAYHHTHGLPISILRPVSIYGPRQYPGWLIARFSNLAIQGQPLPIMGTGEVRRDWIHVLDVCRGLLAAIDGPDGEIVNLGTGREWSVIEIAEMILELTSQPRSLLTFLEARPGDFDRQVTRSEKAQELLGWRAEIPFEEGLKNTLEWYRDHQDWVAVQSAKDADKLGFRVKEEAK